MWHRVSVGIVGLAVFAGTAKANYVTDWNQYLLAEIKVTNRFTVGGDKPPETARNMAMVNAAVFNSLNYFDRAYQFYNYTPAATAPAGASRHAAVMKASYDVMSALYPTQATEIEGYWNTQMGTLDGSGVTEQEKQDGFAIGRSVAEALLNLRGTGIARDGSDRIIGWTPTDGSTLTTTWPDSTEFGKYRTDTITPGANVPAAFPHWGGVTPFVMSSPSQFRRNNIPAFDGQAYADTVNQVKEKGDRRRYDLSQHPEYGGQLPSDIMWEKRTAFFWAGKGLSPNGTKNNNGTVTPPGQWLEAANDYAVANSMSDLETARMLTLLSIASADAGIAAWDMKYLPSNNLWRPIHAIQLAEADPNSPNYNPSITADGSWLPLIPTSNHPEYVSGHSTFSGAAAGVLALFFGTDNVTFTFEGDDALFIDPETGQELDPFDPDAVKEIRTFTSLAAAAEEAGMSRIYGGIHYMFSNTNGLDAGFDIGNWVFSNTLQPVPEPTAVALLGLGAAGLLMRRRRPA